MRNRGLDDDDGRRLCKEWFCILAGHGVRWPEIGVDAHLLAKAHLNDAQSLLDP